MQKSVILKISTSYKVFIFSFFLLLFNKSNALDDYYVIIDSIIINGNNHTKHWVIENEIHFKYKEIYKKSELNALAENSKNSLINTNLFLFAQVTCTEITAKHIVVNVNVSENWYLWPLPCFELSDRNFKQWQNMDYDIKRTNYGFYLFKYNIKGRSETLKIAFVNGYTEKYGIYYFIPYINKSQKNGAEISSTFKKNKEIWYLTKNNKLQFYKNYDKAIIQRWENNIAFIVRKNGFLTDRWELEYNNIQIDEKLIKDSLNSNFLLGGIKQNEIFIKYISIYEKRNNRNYPLTGFYLKNEIKLGTIKSDSTAEIISESIESAIYRKAAKNLYVSGFFKFKMSNQALPFIPYNNFKALGYTDYVRGYEQYVIDGHALMLAKFNIKYALINGYKLKFPFKLNKKYISLPFGTYFNLYADWGKTYNKQWQTSKYGLQNTLANKHLFGFGAGIDFLAMNDKILRIEYTINILDDKNLNLHFKKAF